MEIMVRRNAVSGAFQFWGSFIKTDMAGKTGILGSRKPFFGADFAQFSAFVWDKLGKSPPN